jgi:hypothetical protein
MKRTFTQAIIGLIVVGSAAVAAPVTGAYALSRHQQAARFQVHGGLIQVARPAPPVARPRLLWQQQVVLAAADGAVGDHLGGPVALGGDTALVGAWHKHGAAGAAYVFVRRENGWLQQAELSVRDGRPGDWFGVSVALSGDIALVGAPFAGQAGAAYVFVRDGSHWTQQARLSAHDGAPGDWFGRSVALRGNTALVGAWYKNTHIGAAYIFVRTGRHWTQQAKLTASDGVAEDYFGTAVALSGDTALVGAVGKNDGAGAAYVFVRRGSRWRQQAALTARNGVAEDTFGSAVALAGNTALVGAGFAHKLAGATYVFVRDGSHWTQQAELTARDGTMQDWFGWSVALGDNTALVGAWYKQKHTGAAYLFVRTGTRWTEQAKLTARDGIVDDHFGGSVALSGGTCLVGAGFKNRGTGAVYVFGTAA